MKRAYILIALIMVVHGMKGQDIDSMLNMNTETSLSRYALIWGYGGRTDFKIKYSKADSIYNQLYHKCDSIFNITKDTIAIRLIINGDRHQKIKAKMKGKFIPQFKTLDPIDTNLEMAFFSFDYIKNGDRFRIMIEGNSLENSKRFIKEIIESKLYLYIRNLRIETIMIRDKRTHKLFISKPLKYDIWVTH